MKIKTIILTVILTLFVVIFLQNLQPVKFQLLFWNFPISLTILLLLVLLFGFILGSIFIGLWRRKKLAAKQM